MMTADQVRNALKDSNIQKVAKGSGVAPATIYRFMSPASKPAYDTVKALSDYLEARNDKPA